MARIRTVKPEFFTSLDIAALSMPARLLFIGLWTHADDEGRGLYEPRLIKAAVFPLDDDMTPRAVDNLLSELVAHGLLLKYESDNGDPLFQVSTFAKHQRIDKKRPSRYPSPPALGDVVEDSTNPPVPVPPGKDQGKEQERERMHARCEAVIDAYVAAVCLSRNQTDIGYRSGVRHNAMTERMPKLLNHLTRHPDATDDDLRAVIGLGPLEAPAPKAPEFDPDCPDCAGTGVVFFGNGSLDSRRCECHAVMLGRQDADVIPMRREA